MGCLKLTYREELPHLKVVSNNLKTSSKGCAGLYRYGFQGQEMDDEIKGEGNSVNYKYRMHDPRIGRFFCTDPLEKKYPHNSPYAFSENRVIDAIELEGLEALLVHLDTRVGLWGSKSHSVGIGFDWEGNIWAYHTIGVGGFGGGRTGTMGITIYPTANLDDIKGLGSSYFFSPAVIGSVELSADVTANGKWGGTVQVGGGAAFFIGGEVTYTSVIATDWFGVLEKISEWTTFDVLSINAISEQRNDLIGTIGIFSGQIKDLSSQLMGIKNEMMTLDPVSASFENDMNKLVENYTNTSVKLETTKRKKDVASGVVEGLNIVIDGLTEKLENADN